MTNQEEITLIHRKELVLQLLLYSEHAFNDVCVQINGHICDVVDVETCDQLLSTVQPRLDYFRGRQVAVRHAISGILTAKDGSEARKWAQSIIPSLQ